MHRLEALTGKPDTSSPKTSVFSLGPLSPLMSPGFETGSLEFIEHCASYQSTKEDVEKDLKTRFWIVSWTFDTVISVGKWNQPVDFEEPEFPFVMKAETSTS